MNFQSFYTDATLQLFWPLYTLHTWWAMLLTCQWCFSSSPLCIPVVYWRLFLSVKKILKIKDSTVSSVKRVTVQLWSAGCCYDQKGAVCNYFLLTLCFTNNETHFLRLWLENDPVSPPNFWFAHADTIGPLYMHYFFIRVGHGILTLSFPFSLSDCGSVDVECRVLTKYIICLYLVYFYLSSPLSCSVTSVSVAGRPHWRSYRQSTLKPTSCFMEPTHCGRNLTVRHTVTH